MNAPCIGRQHVLSSSVALSPSHLATVLTNYTSAHYDVDDNFCLHVNSRCSENVDIAAGWTWPVVVMCRWEEFEM